VRVRCLVCLSLPAREVAAIEITTDITLSSLSKPHAYIAHPRGCCFSNSAQKTGWWGILKIKYYSSSSRTLHRCIALCIVEYRARSSLIPARGLGGSTSQVRGLRLSDGRALPRTCDSNRPRCKQRGLHGCLRHARYHCQARTVRSGSS
jgi:hypothetical protein